MDGNSTAARKQAKGLGARHVYEELRREILTLALEPGTPLDETALSQRFGMSRSPVREALVRLSADGLVEMLSNRSTLVAPVDLAGFPRYVEALDVLQRINTRLAARNRSEQDIERMVRLARAFDAACAANDYLAMSATNRDFHMSIAAAGRNPYLAAFYDRLLNQGRRMLHLHFRYLEEGNEGHLLTDEHDEMLAAIRDRNIERADNLAHLHTRQFRDNFMDFMKRNYLKDAALVPLGTSAATEGVA